MSLFQGSSLKNGGPSLEELDALAGVYTDGGKRVTASGLYIHQKRIINNEIDCYNNSKYRVYRQAAFAERVMDAIEVLSAACKCQGNSGGADDLSRALKRFQWDLDALSVRLQLQLKKEVTTLIKRTVIRSYKSDRLER